MDLQKLFVALEKAGVTTLGQARSALVTAGVQPSGLFINHPDLEKAVNALKPAKPAVTATAAASPAPASPSTSDIAEQAALVAKQLSPQIEHLVEVAVNQLQQSIANHMAPIHATLTEVKAVLAAPAPAVPAKS